MSIPGLALALIACSDKSTTDAGVAAIYDEARPSHYFDVPFPSDALRGADGGLDLSGYPRSETLMGTIIGGWLDRLPICAHDYSANAPAYFRFEGPLVLPATTDGLPDDPVVLVDAATGERFPLELRFVEDPLDDPWWGENTLAMVAAVGHTPPSGATLVAAVMQSAGAAPAAGWSPPAEAAAALALAGVGGELAIATVYTVQDTAAELSALAADVDRWAAEDADWSGVAFRRVASIAYAQGETEEGNAATVATATFEDGDTSVAYMAPSSSRPDHSTDLLDGWPMAVYQAEVPVPYYTGFEGQPYMSPGVSHVLDVDDYSGWIDFSPEGALLTAPDQDTARVVLSIPLGDDGEPIEDAPLLIWDHGTGGTAYNFVQRKDPEDQSPALNAAFAEAGFAVLARDQPMYGTRFPLIDEGFSDGSLGFYNVVNLPAFRDNQRQGGIEGQAVWWFAREALNGALPAGSVDPDRIRRGGHSLGGATSIIGLGAAPEIWEAGLLSGAASVFTLSFLESGLGGTDSSFVESLGELFGVEVDEDTPFGALIGAALGLEEEESLARVDRLHPAVSLFQWIVDPSDGSTFARTSTAPQLVMIGEGDWQVPNRGSEGLVSQLPDADLFTCTPSSEGYDPHYCIYREPEAWDALSGWLTGER